MFSAWRDRLDRTLGLRLAAWYLATFLASTVVIGSLTYGLLSSSLQARDREIIDATLRDYAARYQDGGIEAVVNAVEVEQRSTGREHLFVRVVDPFQDVLLYSSSDAWGAFDLSRLNALSPGQSDAWDRIQAETGGAVLDVGAVQIDRGTILQVGKTSEGRDELLARYRRVLLLVAGAALGIGLVGGLVLTKSTLKPLRDLSDTASRILATGQTELRVRESGGGDALDELAHVFNAMLARITTLIGGMRDALDNVAHDLRTPMTRLRVTAESALASGDAARQRDALSDCLEESERALSMLTTLMDISEAETGTMRLSFAPVRIADVVSEVAALYEDTAEEKGLTFAVEAAPDTVVRADRDRLRQALANLVDNAVKYTPSGGRIAIAVEHDGGQARVRVSDTGAGIAAHDLPRIWDRLYRGDQSRASRGLGLGLSLVRASIEAQGGTVEVASEPGRGSTFTVTLPELPGPPPDAPPQLSRL